MCKDANAPACDCWRRVFCCFVTVGGEGSAVFSHDRVHFPARDPSYKRGRASTVASLCLFSASSPVLALALRLLFPRILLVAHFAFLVFDHQLRRLSSKIWRPVQVRSLRPLEPWVCAV